MSRDDDSLAAIATARVGDEVRLHHDGKNWFIEDEHGKRLGRMARSWFPPAGRKFARGAVGAVIIWKKTDNQEEFRTYIQRDRWEVVLPELVFE